MKTNHIEHNNNNDNDDDNNNNNMNNNILVKVNRFSKSTLTEQYSAQFSSSSSPSLSSSLPNHSSTQHQNHFNSSTTEQQQHQHKQKQQNEFPSLAIDIVQDVALVQDPSFHYKLMNNNNDNKITPLRTQPIHQQQLPQQDYNLHRSNSSIILKEHDDDEDCLSTSTNSSNFSNNNNTFSNRNNKNNSHVYDHIHSYPHSDIEFSTNGDTNVEINNNNCKKLTVLLPFNHQVGGVTSNHT